MINRSAAIHFVPLIGVLFVAILFSNEHKSIVVAFDRNSETSGAGGVGGGSDGGGTDQFPTRRQLYASGTSGSGQVRGRGGTDTFSPRRQLYASRTSGVGGGSDGNGTDTFSPWQQQYVSGTSAAGGVGVGGGTDPFSARRQHPVGRLSSFSLAASMSNLSMDSLSINTGMSVEQPPMTLEQRQQLTAGGGALPPPPQQNQSRQRLSGRNLPAAAAAAASNTSSSRLQPLGSSGSMNSLAGSTSFQTWNVQHQRQPHAMPTATESAAHHIDWQRKTVSAEMPYRQQINEQQNSLNLVTSLRAAAQFADPQQHMWHSSAGENSNSIIPFQWNSSSSQRQQPQMMISSPQRPSGTSPRPAVEANVIGGRRKINLSSLTQPPPMTPAEETASTSLSANKTVGRRRINSASLALLAPPITVVVEGQPTTPAPPTTTPIPPTTTPIPPTTTPTPESGEKECVVCLDKQQKYLFPCGHLCMCEECANKIFATTKKCPICRKSAEIKIHFYRS